MRIAHPELTDIQEIMHLNNKYLIQNLTDAQKRTGYLGKKYSQWELERIILDKEIIIAMDKNKIAGYYLIGRKDDAGTAPYERNKAIELLINGEVTPDKIAWPCMVCIDDAYRGRGLFGAMLQALMQAVQEKYVYVLCSIAEQNIVSIKAHLKNGWELINTFEERQYLLYNVPVNLKQN
jgi:RimJ/RimL family protein N-acetyltransferase